MVLFLDRNYFTFKIYIFLCTISQPANLYFLANMFSQLFLIPLGLKPYAIQHHWPFSRFCLLASVSFLAFMARLQSRTLFYPFYSLIESMTLNFIICMDNRVMQSHLDIRFSPFFTLSKFQKIVQGLQQLSKCLTMRKGSETDWENILAFLLSLQAVLKTAAIISSVGT